MLVDELNISSTELKDKFELCFVKVLAGWLLVIWSEVCVLD